MNEVIKNTLENKHVLIIAMFVWICFMFSFYFENMYQSMFQGYHTIYEHCYWISQVNYYSTMTVTMFAIGGGLCGPLFFFLTRDIVIPLIKGN